MDTGILPGAFALMLALYQSRFAWANAGDFGSWVGGRVCATYWATQEWGNHAGASDSVIFENDTPQELRKTYEC